jgi:hypothetical protein
MAEQQDYSQDMSMDISIRINDLEQKNSLMKEKLDLITKNFISIKEELDEKVSKIDKENFEIKKEFDQIKKSLKILREEAQNFIRRDEIVIIERMLKDFQPIEFVRRKDMEEKINELKKLLEKNKNP